MLSKDHFSNVLNEPAGNVAAEILKFIAPRVLYAWEHADVPVQQVMRDVEGMAGDFRDVDELFHLRRVLRHEAVQDQSLGLEGGDHGYPRTCPMPRMTYL